MRRALTHLAVPACVLMAIVSFACSSGDDDDIEAARKEVEAAAQKLVLTVDGSPLELPLIGMDVYLTEDDNYPESFHIKGDGLSLGGQFPKGVRVDYGEDWKNLIGKQIPISATGGDPREPGPSTVTLPGQGSVPVAGGTIVFEKFGKSYDAKTPLRGTIQLQLQPAGGAARTLEGTIEVKGTTWG